MDFEHKNRTHDKGKNKIKILNNSSCYEGIDYGLPLFHLRIWCLGGVLSDASFHPTCKEEASFTTREISSIRKYITTKVAQTLIQSMVISHLHYGNSLLYGISEQLLTKLQRVLGYTKYYKDSCNSIGSPSDTG